MNAPHAIALKRKIQKTMQQRKYFKIDKYIIKTNEEFRLMQLDGVIINHEHAEK